MSTGILFSIEEFAVNDGPGIRTTVFLKGCPLNCVWCHNPEGQRFAPELMTKSGRPETCGYEISAADLAKRILRDRDIFEESGGGVTFTGGEPLSQSDFLLEVMTILGDKVHKVVETSGFAKPDVFESVMEKTDLFLFDIKLVDGDRHREYTGKDNGVILANLSRLMASGKPFVVRVPLIPGVNDSLENMKATADLLEGSTGLQRVELLRYHKTAGAKYSMLGRRYNPPFDTEAEPMIHDEFMKKGIKLLIL